MFRARKRLRPKKGKTVVDSGGGAIDRVCQRPLLSSVFLIVSNLMPLWFVIFHKWGVFTVLSLSWLENVLIGAFNAPRIAMAAPPPHYSSSRASFLLKLILISFFIFHYGIFTLAHGVLVVLFFGPKRLRAGMSRVFGYGQIAHLISLVLKEAPSIRPPFAGLVVSHGVSFFSNYIGRGEFRRVRPGDLFVWPYARVLLLHVTVLFGGLAAKVTGEHRIAVGLLVILKIVMDLMAHWAERTKFVEISSA